METQKKKDVPRNFWKNICSLISFIRLNDKRIFLWIGSSIVLSALVPFPYILLSRKVIDAFTGNADYTATVKIIALMVALDWLLRTVNQFIDTELDKKVKRLEYGAIQRLFYKMSDLDYELLDDADTKDKFGKATKCVMSLNFYELVLSVRTFFSGGLILLGVMGIIGSVDPVLLVVISLVILANAYANSRLKKYRYRMDSELWPIDRKMEWFMQFSANIEYAKEIRVNQLQEFIFQKYRKLSDHYYGLLDRITDSEGIVRYIGILLSALQEGMAYLVLGFKILVEKTLTVGEFTMVFGAITSFKNACSGMIGGIIEVLNRGRYFSNYLEFMELEGNNRKGDAPAEVRPGQGVEIEFKHVSFRYPNQNKYALKDINVKLAPFTRVAVIGDNGAGKTSFIKLLCRLYEPEEGQIMINGRDIRELDYRSYQKILSVVFQDYKLFSFSVRENILFSQDREREEEIYQKAAYMGADAMLKALPQGLDTLLFKDYDAAGVNLSGGEGQKVAILRALFKESEIMILDEPTAALDPDAEKKIYESFQAFSKGKTAVYISHRLASARYCDKILVFKDGELCEQGDHESLMALGGEYKRLYQIQAGYYAEKAAG
ncbi:MAG: ABC transporter ATP-binding protein [Lachnospiraceae bacterium]|nr:ABC transporter ATP-binding protein [Lachnospiraceae bacterium]